MHFDEVTRDREPETESPCSRVGAESACRNRLNKCGRNSGSIPMPVSLTETSILETQALEAHAHEAAMVGEFHRVREQVPQDPLEAVGDLLRYARRWIDGRLDPDRLHIGGRQRGFDRGADALGAEIDRLKVETHLASCDRETSSTSSTSCASNEAFRSIASTARSWLGPSSCRLLSMLA